MALRDVLAGEQEDNRRATEAAIQGRSLTGLSGRHTQMEGDFANRDDVFGGPVDPPRRAEPLMGERVERQRQMQQIGDPSLDSLIGDDPIFRHNVEPLRERVPFGAYEQQLAVAPRRGYRRYWFNDAPGRVLRAKRAGYSHVIDQESGENMSRITDKVDGRGRSSYLMEIPIQWYHQDMARQAADLDRRLHDIRTGKAGPGAEDGRYIPQQGIRITGR